MRPPTPKQLSAHYDATITAAKKEQQTDSPTLTCTWCGTTGPYYYVQPQHPFYADGRENAARCIDCHNAENARRKEAARTARAAAPKCEACQRSRGTWKALGTLLCGRCLKRARTKIAAQGIFGFLGSASMTRETLLSIAAPDPR